MTTPTPQRRAEIARLLAHNGAVRVADLVARFGTSEPAIRRDLEWLEGQGLARRVRGGAVAFHPHTEPLSSPDTIPARIGKAAAGLVEAGETVFLGPGPLTLEVARALAGLPSLTVITNGLAIARQVADHTHHTLIVTGGQLERGEGELAGHLARMAMGTLRADRVILELGGVNAAEGLTDDRLSQAELARMLFQRGMQVVVLVPPERVGRVAAVYIGPVTDADVIVTAREADSAPLWDLAETGVRILLA
ncbi:MAG: DeoR/GlpR family DNA-binding transcription regulator [Anaerolineae bacterium]|nr:DeoR/GlpR family DNA-binding transcription regulator [Anaerolineae bacterium]